MLLRKCEDLRGLCYVQEARAADFLLISAAVVEVPEAMYRGLDILHGIHQVLASRAPVKHALRWAVGDEDIGALWYQLPA